MELKRYEFWSTPTLTPNTRKLIIRNEQSVDFGRLSPYLRICNSEYTSYYIGTKHPLERFVGLFDVYWKGEKPTELSVEDAKALMATAEMMSLPTAVFSVSPDSHGVYQGVVHKDTVPDNCLVVLSKELIGTLVLERLVTKDAEMIARLYNEGFYSLSYTSGFPDDEVEERFSSSVYPTLKMAVQRGQIFAPNTRFLRE